MKKTRALKNNTKLSDFFGKKACSPELKTSVLKSKRKRGVKAEPSRKLSF